MSGAPLHPGDRCPGALRLHQAADGALARIRVPGGRLTVAQLSVLAELADAVGDGALHITARGNLEMRAIRDAERLTTALQGCALLPSRTHERVRNLIASPDPRLDALVTSLDQAVCAHPPLADLSGRFLFGLDGGAGDVVALAPDVAAVLRADGSAALAFAGRSTGHGVAAHDVPAALTCAAHAFLTSAPGVWRLRDTDPHCRAALADEMLHAVRHLIDTRPDVEALPRDPGLGPVPGRGDGGRELTVAVRLGRATTASWRALGALAARGDGIVRLTPWRRVVVGGFDPAVVVADLPERADLLVDADHPGVGLGACTGTPGCSSSLADVRAAAWRSIQPGHEWAPPLRLPSREAPVYWAGCSRACGHPSTAHTRVTATEAGYRVHQYDDQF